MNYLAGPYRSIHSHIMERRYNQLTFVAAQLMLRGETIFSPITHCHYLAKEHASFEGPEFWLTQDLAILRRCDKMYVLQLDGWKQSNGLRDEIAFATEHNIPVEYITLEDFSGQNSQHSRT